MKIVPVEHGSTNINSSPQIVIRQLNVWLISHRGKIYTSHKPVITHYIADNELHRILDTISGHISKVKVYHVRHKIQRVFDASDSPVVYDVQWLLNFLLWREGYFLI